MIGSLVNVRPKKRGVCTPRKQMQYLSANNIVS